MRLGAIGDVANALVFAGALREEAPESRLDWVVHPLSRPLVEGHPWIDRVHVFERGGGLPELRRLRRALRAERYGLAVDLQRIAKSALVARLSGAPRVLGYDRGRAKELSWLLSTERIPAGHPRDHMVEHYLQFARALGLQASRPRHELPRDPAAEAWAEERLTAFGSAPLVLHIGASKPQNRWPARRYGEVLVGLAKARLGPVVLTGGPGDREDADVALEVGGAERAADQLLDLVGRTTLPQLIALLRRARLFLGCDTGPMHLAAAVGRRVVALFGPADPLRTGPYGARHLVLRDPPAGADRGIALPPATMESLASADVLEQVRDLLEVTQREL